MIHIAVVEDENRQADKLIACLKRFEEETGEQFEVTRYCEALSFLNEKKRTFQIVFMDIMLPGINGMEAAERLRRFDTQTILIFVTNMLNFAVKSYEVDAMDYIVKPISYERVVFKLRKAINIINSSTGRVLSISTRDGIVQLSTEDIYYIEVIQHRLFYHTSNGNFSEKNSLKTLEEALTGNDFSRCNSCYLVNMKYIAKVDGLIITMTNGDELKISQPKRKGFMTDLGNYLGQGK